MKALEKDRDRRYETANGLATDLQRYLADEPVEACPPSVRYRLRKFVRRNKGPVLAACLGRPGPGGRHHRHDLGHDSRHRRAGRRRERDETERGRAGGGPAERAGRHRPVVPGAVEPGPRRPLQPADGPAAGQPRRPGPGRPHPPRRAAARRGHRRDGLARRPPRARSGTPSPPGTAAVAYDGQYRLYARADTRGIISIRSLPDDQEVRRIASGPLLAKYLFFSPDDRFLLGRGEGYTLRVWRVADGQPVLRGRAPRVPGARVQPGRPAPGGRPARVGPLLRSGDRAGSEALALARAGQLAGVSPGRTADWPSATSIPTSLPCTTRRAGPSSRTCPWVR